jgi:hypothetical protein
VFNILDVENSFQINHREKSFHVFASSATDKSNWLSNLKKYITKAQAGRGRGSSNRDWSIACICVYARNGAAGDKGCVGA